MRKCDSMLVVACCMLLAGCTQTNEAVEDTAEQTLTADESHVVKTFEENNIQIDADVEAMERDVFYIYHAEKQPPSAETLLQVFLPEEENPIMTVQESNQSDIIWSEDETQRILNASLVLYENREQEQYLDVINIAVGFDNLDWAAPERIESVSEDGALEFMTSEEAKNLVSDVSDRLGICLEEEPVCCQVLDVDTLNGLKEQAKENGLESESDFEELGGCYYLVWNGAGPDGERMISGNYNINQVTGAASGMNLMLYAVVNQTGLVYYRTSGNPFVFSEGEEITTSLISLNEAIEKVNARYENVINTSPIKIDKIEMVYRSYLSDVDAGEYTVVPTWTFYGTTVNHDIEQTLVMSVNAVDGEIMQ